MNTMNTMNTKTAWANKNCIRFTADSVPLLYCMFWSGLLGTFQYFYNSGNIEIACSVQRAADNGKKNSK